MFTILGSFWSRFRFVDFSDNLLILVFGIISRPWNVNHFLLVWRNDEGSFDLRQFLAINLRDTGACPHTLSSPVRMISFIAMEYVDQLGAGACTIIFFPCLERDHLLSTNQNAPFIATASISRLSVHVNMPWPRFTFGSPRGFIMIISPHLHKPLPPNIHFIVGECIAG